ncbi:RHS repeat-associated core domain-containing protein [Burkholderia catarinensis]|uniref:RHS repeat-associated core domain-containing protein n=1 Tax=Burkholderia catarinensis TaxID=1108140 RepID=UPI0009144263|nr:RHS repeat-associated core domain-containing protein [Burkholderia catarinensis]KAG8154560.1 hypothetical protein BFF94_007305 [Burkholderia catarinensis]
MSESESRLTRASESSESHATQSEAKADTACDSLLDTVKSTFDPFKETFSSDGSVLHHVSAAVNSLASLQGMPSQLLNTGIAQIPLLDKVPGMPAATIGVPHLGTPHAHSHPPSNGFPLPSAGMTIGSGCLSVLIGGIPAARVLDIGFAPTCGGLTPYFDIQTGSSNTFIGGMRAARMGIDMTRHCNPMGHVGKSGGEAASAAEKSEEVASEAAQVTGRAKALGRAGKAWSVGNAAVGPASGAATAASDIKHHEVLAAAMTAAQTAADLAFMMLSNLMGKDPGIEPSMGTLLLGDPTVLIGGFPLPDSQMMWHGAKHGIGKKVRPKLPKLGQELTCEFFGEPISAVTGEVKNDFTDYETDITLPFKWRRHYCSGWNTRNGALGYGFRHAWQHELQLLRTRAIYTDPRGSEYVFIRNSDGTYGGCCLGYELEQLDGVRFTVSHEVEGTTEFARDTISNQSARCVGHMRGKTRSVLHCSDDGRLQRISQTDERGQTRRVIGFGYDRFGRIFEVMLTDVDGRMIRIAQYEYDVNSCLTGFRNALDAMSVCEYDSQRRIMRLIDANKYSFFYCYDSEGRCLDSTGQDGMWRVQFKYQPGRTIVTEADGGKWTVIYNEMGTISQVVDPYGGTTEYVLDQFGTIVKEIDSGERVLRWLYNARDRNTSRIDRWGYIWPVKDDAPVLPNPLGRTISGVPMDLQWGNVTRAWLPDTLILPSEVASMAASTYAPAPPALKPSEQRDAAGRVITRIDEHGRTECFRHDAAGNLLLRRDCDGRDYHYSSVSWNLRQSETDPLDSTVQYRYTPKRKIAAIVDANGNESTYTYDLKDRITSVRRHGVLRETYTYDAGDRLVEKCDGAGNVLLRFEVGDNGLYSKRLLASGEIHSYAYDAQGNFTKASTDSFDVTITRDAFGRRTGDQRDARGVEHAYVDERLASTSHFERFQVRYEAVGAYDVLIHPPVGGTQRLQRTSDGRILLRLGNGTSALFTYDSLGRCTGRVTWSNDRSMDLHRVQYQYSPTGELQRVIDSVHGTTEYQYNAAHRLICETRNGGEARRFEYDRGGNLLSMPALRWMRYTEGNRLTSAPTGEFRYNDRNHVAEELNGDRHIGYHYNSMDLLVKVTRSDRHDTWTAEYDGLCRRIAKALGGARTEYFWDGDRIAAEVGPAGDLRVYVYVNEAALLPFMFIDYPDVGASPEAGRAYFVFGNQVGLPEWIEDSEGGVAWRAEHIDPYGKIVTETGNSIDYDLRFPGHYHDAETGLHYNRFRSYNPVLGRYLQSDPAGQSGGINLYAYATNPLVSVDVLGLSHDHEPESDSTEIGNNESGSSTEAPKTKNASHETEKTQNLNDLFSEIGNPLVSERINTDEFRAGALEAGLKSQKEGDIHLIDLANKVGELGGRWKVFNIARVTLEDGTTFLVGAQSGGETLSPRVRNFMIENHIVPLRRGWDKFHGEGNSVSVVSQHTPRITSAVLAPNKPMCSNCERNGTIFQEATGVPIIAAPGVKFTGKPSHRNTGTEPWKTFKS